MAGKYDDLKKAELVELAESRGVDTDGNKAEIAKRLEASDAASADQPTEDLSDVTSEIDGGPDADAGTIDADDDADDPDAGPGDKDEDEDEEEGDDEDDGDEPEDAPEPEPEPAVAVPVGHQPVHEPVADDDLANQGRPPNKRGVQPWDKIKVEVLTGLRESASDLWEEGKEQIGFLGAIAEDIAKQTWLAKFGDVGQKRNAVTNLKHLSAQVRSRTALVKMHLIKQGDSLLLKVLQTTIRVAIGALVSAVV